MMVTYLFIVILFAENAVKFLIFLTIFKKMTP
jgi:hypothetical protein